MTADNVIAIRQPGKIVAPSDWSDAQVAEGFADHLRGRYRWSAQIGWLRWDGRRWADDHNEGVLEIARQWVLALCSTMVSTGSNEDVRRSAMYRSANKISALVVLARRMHGIATRPDELDPHPGLLNCMNGIVDLHAGELLPHDPERLITKLAPVEWDPDVVGHPDWTTALEAVDADVSTYLQAVFGYIAAGTADRDLVPVLDGGGSNGKTTILTAVAHALGDYAQPISRDMIVVGSRGEHPTQFAELHHTRLAYLEELPEDGVLRTEIVKALSGGGRIRARRLYHDAFTFDTTHTLIIATNHRPTVYATEDAVWRRLRLVPFPRRFTGPDDTVRPGDLPKDPQLRDRLRTGVEQRQAVLSWIIDGAFRYYTDPAALTAPPSVAHATTDWRTSEDRVFAFIVETLIPDPTGEVMGADLFQKYESWAQRERLQPWSNKAFAKHFIEHHLVRAHRVEKVRSNGISYRGIRLRLELETEATWTP